MTPDREEALRLAREREQALIFAQTFLDNYEPPNKLAVVCRALLALAADLEAAEREQGALGKTIENMHAALEAARGSRDPE